MRRRPFPLGLTLIELMVVLAVSAVLVTLAVPSMREFMLRQRVKAVNAELVNDLQFARSESIARSSEVGITFRSDEAMTCYTVHTPLGDCDCRQPVGSACPDLPELVEIKTVQVPRSSTVRVEPLVGLGNVLLFSGASGLASPGEFKVGVESPVSGKLHTSTNAVGRPQVCAPDSSIGGVAACPD